MKPAKLSICVLLGLALLGLGFIIDEDPLKPLLERLETVSLKYPQEKIYIQTDRSYYAAGDTIWFKSYLVNAVENRSSDYSKVIYLDFIDPKDSVNISMKLPMIAGLSWGDIPLPEGLPEGTYRLRAYTNWMRNFGDEFYFDRNIKIGPSFRNKVFTNIEYSYSKDGDKDVVQATLHVSDELGNPLADKQISYAATLDSRNVARGRGKTDSEGKLAITFTNNQGDKRKTGILSANIVLDKDKSVTKLFTIKSTSTNATVQFFPESGQMVDGIMSKVAFKAIGDDGLSRACKGVVKDESGTEVSTFTSSYAGMGSFTLNPRKDDTYTATVTFSDGSQKNYPLPKVQASGYVLSAAVRGDLLLSIQTTEDLLNKGTVSVVASQNGIVKYVGKKQISESETQTKVSLERFNTGIVVLTLFSQNNQPIAERLIFVRKPEADLKISTDKPSYNQREKVNLTFNASSITHQPAITNLSVAVINESKAPSDENEDPSMVAELLLSSDLKGYIETPNYYFLNPDEKKNEQLDNLLLTQGWRRFNWQRLTTAAPPTFDFKAEHGIDVSGRLTTYGNKPIVGSKVMIMASKGAILILDTVTDTEGRFNFKNLDVADSTTIVVQGRTAKGKKGVNIELDKVPAQLVSKSRNYDGVSINVDNDIREYLSNRRNDVAEMLKYGVFKRNIILDEVQIVEKRRQENYSNNLNGTGNADYTLNNEKLMNFITIDQALMQVPGIIVRGGIPYSTRSLNTPMEIILDGMSVDVDILQTIMPSDVETIEVLRTPGYTAIYGMRGGGGVLVITTRRGSPNYVDNTPVAGITLYRPKGYAKTRVFYAPDYEVSPQLKQLPDRRTTVYWEPNISTDSTGTGRKSFFTAGESGTYKVVAEGLDGNGAIYHKVIRFQVR